MEGEIPMISQTGKPTGNQMDIPLATQGSLKRQFAQSGDLGKITHETLFNDIDNEDIKRILEIFQDYLISSRKTVFHR